MRNDVTIPKRVSALDVSWHGEFDVTLAVVPREDDADEEAACPVGGDGI